MADTTVIGDIHGSSEALRSLLKKIIPGLGADSTIVTLGDYIDRGPDTRDVIDQLLNLRQHTPAKVVSLLGNHEDWMLRTMDDFTTHSWLLGMNGFSTIHSYSPDAAAEIRQRVEELGSRLYSERISLPYELFFDAVPDSHVQFFQGLRDCFEDANGFYSHAGFDPLTPLNKQKRRTLVWGDHSDFSLYSGKTVVYGHWNNTQSDDNGRRIPTRSGDTIGIDSIAHGVLTALHLPTQTILQAGNELD